MLCRKHLQPTELATSEIVQSGVLEAAKDKHHFTFNAADETECEMNMEMNTHAYLLFMQAVIQERVKPTCSIFCI